MINPRRERIAIIGAGAAGLSAAWRLGGRHDVAVFEREGHLGGHARTVEVEEDGRPVMLDLGFMVFNRRNYPEFTRLLQALGGIEAGESEMSFGYYAPSGRAGYVVNWDPRARAREVGETRDLLPELIGEIVRFCRAAREDLEADRLGDLSLGAYLRLRDFPASFADRYAIAMGSAIWSTPPRSLTGFPAVSFLRFFANHGLLDMTDPPQWLHIRGGSRRYVEAIEATLAGATRRRETVALVRRVPGGVLVHVDGRAPERFDHAVLAVHADEVLGILADPSDEERACFSEWRYERNGAVLHTDARLMPPDRRMWAAWNYRAEPDEADGPLAITYYLNRLQGLDERGRAYFLTLNLRTPLSPGRVLGTYSFTHPVYSGRALSARRRMAALNGRGGVWYCGSYFGHGFHEDAVRSGLDVAARLEGAR